MKNNTFLLIFLIFNCISADEILSETTCTNGECYIREADAVPGFYWSDKTDAGAWTRHDMGADPTVKPRFDVISVQPDTAGFESEVYNSPH